MEGTIKSLVRDRGFGFITPDGETQDIFFHRNELQGVNYEDLKEGDRMSFEVAEGQKGKNAVKVSRI